MHSAVMVTANIPVTLKVLCFHALRIHFGQNFSQAGKGAAAAERDIDMQILTWNIGSICVTA